MNYTNLNRRHKVGLFLVIVATGLGLFLDASMKQTAGVVLLGLAATWLIGSLGLRTLWLLSSVVVSGIGIFITAKPILEEWESFRSSSEVYARGLSDLHVAIASGKVDWSKFGPPEPLNKKQGQFTSADITDNVPIPDSIRYWQQSCSDFVTDVTPWEESQIWKGDSSTLVYDEPTKKWLIPITLPHGFKLKVKAAVASLSKFHFPTTYRPKSYSTL